MIFATFQCKLFITGFECVNDWLHGLRPQLRKMILMMNCFVQRSYFVCSFFFVCFLSPFWLKVKVSADYFWGIRNAWLNFKSLWFPVRVAFFIWWFLIFLLCWVNFSVDWFPILIFALWHFCNGSFLFDVKNKFR